MDRGRLRAIVAALFVIMLFGLSTVLSKLALREMPPLTMAMSTGIVAWVGLSFYLFILRRRSIPRGLDRGTWVRVCAMGVGSFTVSRIFYMLSLQRMEATTSSFLSSFTGVFTLIIGMFVMREFPSVWQVVGTAVSIVGVYIFYPAVPAREELIGVGMKVVGMATTGTTNNISRDVASSGKLDFLMFSWLSTSVGILPLPFLTLWLEGVPHYTRMAIPAILFVGLVSSGFGLTVWNGIMRDLQAFEASLIGNTIIIWTAVFGWILLGEQFSFRKVVAALVVLGGTALIQIRRRRLIPCAVSNVRHSSSRD